MAANFHSSNSKVSTKPNRKVFFIIMILPICLFHSALSAAPNKIDELKTSLSSGNYSQRILAAQQLGSETHVDSEYVVSILINALANEVKYPLSVLREHCSGFTYSEELKAQYCNSIAALSNANSRSILTSIDTSTGELQHRLTLVLANLGNQSLHPQVRRIFQENKDGYLRYRAILALEQYNDPGDVPIFAKALMDSFWIAEFIDSSQGTPINMSYPIRIEAASTLTKMGYILKWHGWNYEIIGKSEGNH